MLTDIFSHRYRETTLWNSFGEADRRFLYQAFQIVRDELLPYYDSAGKEKKGAKEIWKRIHDKLSTELGLRELSPHVFVYPTTFQGKISNHVATNILPRVCEVFLTAPFSEKTSADEYLKNRISLIEIAFQEAEAECARYILAFESMPDPVQDFLYKSALRVPGDRAAGRRSIVKNYNDEFSNAVAQLNTRFRQAGYPLAYHNGHIQRYTDPVIEENVERPFWPLIAGADWKNVDIDIKDAIDLRDNNGRDPSFYAAKALESTIKIISDAKGWSHGGEKGAHNYLDNLGSKKSGAFISEWEKIVLKEFFTSVRNPFSHGAGSGKMPTLTPQQTDWSIGFCMIWIKSLIQRM